MSNCKQCGAAVIWTQTDGRWRCFNAGTETDHWDSCSKRRWEQVKATGKHFDHDRVAGYAGSIHGTKYYRISSGVIRGRQFPKPQVYAQCRQCVPPWEECPGCPIQFKQVA
jgi:hypothetical protein